MYKKVEKIPISLLLENPEQPRVDYGNLDELSKSLKQFGQIHPIKVSKIPGSEKMYIVAGHRRTRASKIAGLETVDAVVCEPMTTEELKAVAFAENIHRRQLTPAETAVAIKELYAQNPSYTKKEISKILAISKSAVVNYVKALSVEDEIFSKMIELNLGRDIMLFIANLKQKKLQEKVLQILSENPKTSIDVLKNMVAPSKVKKTFNIVTKPTSSTIFFGTSLTKDQQIQIEEELRIAIRNFVKKNKKQGD